MPVSSNFTRYFGVVGTVYSGWHSSNATSLCPYFPANPADFVGAYSIDPSQWPEIAVDTTLLKSRYRWSTSLTNPFRWIPEIPAMPEVNWSARAFGTEVMYLYKSLYGNSHPMGFEFNFEGSPVAHRFHTSQYKTVHFNFTLPGMEQESIKELAFGVIDWLYPENIPAGVSVVDRYKDAPNKVSLEDAMENFRQRRIEEAMMNATEIDVVLR